MPTGPKHGDVRSIMVCSKCGTQKVVASSKQHTGSYLCPPCYSLNIEKKVCEARLQRVGVGASSSGASAGADVIFDIEAEISKRVKEAGAEDAVSPTLPSLSELCDFAYWPERK